MSERENILNELKDIAPELVKFKEEQPGPGFEVPPRYFNDLKQVLMQEIQLEKKQKTIDGPTLWWQTFLQGLQNILQPKPALALATVALLIAAGIWFSQPDQDLDQAGNEMALNDDDLEAYVLANIDDFETDVLIDMYAETFPEETEEPVTEDNLEEVLQEMDDEDFEDLWESESFKE